MLTLLQRRQVEIARWEHMQSDGGQQPLDATGRPMARALVLRSQQASQRARQQIGELQSAIAHNTQLKADILERLQANKT